MTGGGCDLAVIGGGLIGASIAWGAARAGARVTVLDEGDRALRASTGTFGLIWLQGKGVGTPPYMRWSIRSGELWEEFASELRDGCGVDVGWRRPGGLHFCFEETELAERRAIAARSRADGGDIGMEILDRATVAELVPAIGPEVIGASFSPADAHVDPLATLEALHLDLLRRGATVRRGHRVERIAATGSGFRLDGRDGSSVACDRVVIASGLGGTALAAGVGLHLPVRPERGQILVTERVAPCFPFAASNLRQTEQGTFLIGSSHEQAGMDTGTDVATAAALARGAIRVLPHLADVAVVRHWGSLRILSPDGLPIYDRSATHPGAFVATCHSGVTLAAVHALDVGPALAAGRLPAGLEPFSTERFDVSTS